MANVMTVPGPFALALMKALGLPARTRSFELRCAVNEVVTVKCEYHPDESTAAGFDPQPLLAEYRLVSKADGACEAVGQSAGVAVPNVTKMDLAPGDTVVLKVKDHLSIEQKQRVHQYVASCLPVPVSVVVIDGGADITVLSPQSL
ncbi:hypothetical protein AB4156_16320 [Cupriavidus sp. 2MCAB6]|uniref:hypothetical protein n=1 Tax=Cupriavidus sp. 2MCAB6 TaxID=3232981 RepID=UPI003F9228CA